MSKHGIICTFLIVLLLAVPAFSQGGRGDQPGAALSFCNECSFTISNDTVDFGNFGLNHTQSYHDVYIDASTYVADEIYLTFFINTTDWIYYSENSVFETPSTYTTYSTDDGLWVHYEWTNIVDPPGTTESILNFDFYGPSCVSPDYELHIEFKDSSSASWHNQFHCSSGVLDPYTLNDGYRVFDDPIAKVTVVGPDDETGDTIAVTYEGGTVEVPIWLDTLNFTCWPWGGIQDPGYFSFTVGLEDGLTYSGFTTTAYSGYSVPIDTTVANEITISSGSYGSPALPVGDALFGTITFDVDEDVVAPGDAIKLWIKGNYTFYACSQFSYTGNSDGDTVKVSIPEKEASWRIGSALKCKGLQNVGLPFYLSTNALVYTDVGYGAINAAFTFDSSYLDNTTFDYVTAEYSYNGGTMYWNCITTNPPNVKIFEDPFALNPSTTVKVTGNYEAIGQLVLDLADVVYTDSLVFVNDNEYDNYVVFTYDEDTLDGFDANMTLVNGAISTKTCSGPGPDPLCPALYVWTGKTFTLQDYVLTQSQTQLSATAVDDYLPISYGIAEEDGYYRIQIREFENEITFLDQVELVVAEYPDESQIGISIAGEIFTHHEEITPIAAVDELGSDVLSLIGSEDGLLYESHGPGSLTLTYRNTMGEERQDFGVSLLSAPPKENPEPSGTATADATGDYLYAEIEDANGNWQYLGGIPPREHSTATSQWAFDNFTSDLGETFRVKITWTREYSVDCQTLQLHDNAPVTEHHLSPVEATHTVAGKVAGSLTGVDADIITLSPGETVELTFKAPERIRGYRPNRAFYLKTHGYYESMSKQGNVLPDNYALDDNYPNPFNPSTNIGFSLPQRQEVTLRVFNLLGQEVKTVFQGELDQGHHMLTWYGEDNSGESVASGVYFYRLKTKDFAESKKMMLLK